ncbi:MAG: hypothetical protein L0G99_08720, partial [Propionibacteriales bacterium]|nr:hypothetical protein [Propionibacteriales bacterium]
MKIRRIGLILAVVLSVAGLVPALIIGPDPATGRIGIVPMVIAVFAAVATVTTLALLVPAWRGGARASMIIAVLQLAGILTALPAFFAPTELAPPGGVVLAALGTLLAVAIFTMIIFDASVWMLHLVTVIIIVALYAAGVAVLTSLVP